MSKTTQNEVRHYVTQNFPEVDVDSLMLRFDQAIFHGAMAGHAACKIGNDLVKLMKAER